MWKGSIGIVISTRRPGRLSNLFELAAELGYQSRHDAGPEPRIRYDRALALLRDGYGEMGAILRPRDLDEARLPSVGVLVRIDQEFGKNQAQWYGPVRRNLH
jgi:hypothetical protein